MVATSSHTTGLRRWVIVLAVPVAALIAVGAFVLAPTQGGKSSAEGQLVFQAKRGPLTISVTESGTIKARDQEILKCEVEGQTTIIYLVPEGKLVKAGELLVELDASQLQDNRVEQQIQVQNAEAAFIRATEDLAVAESQATSDIAKAELDYQFAQEDVNQYLDGEYPKQLKEADSNITLAKEELERAAEKLKWSEMLFKEKYISQTELEADLLTKNRAQLGWELAVTSRDLLKNFTYHRTLDQLKSDVDQTKMALDRVKRQAQADIKQAQAELTAKRLEFEQQKGKLQKVEDQLTKTKIVAPIDGMVIYATSAKMNFRGNQEPLDEGQAVREREELIYLPTAEAKMAEVKVHESNLDKVKVGLPVRVTVDALPGQVFTGRVATIAPLPDATSLWLNPDLKIYTTQINLDGSSEEFRTGMTCQVEIIVEHYDDVVYVPIQAVLRVANQPTVYVQKDGQFESRPVELGLDNNRMVRILSGLQPGESVWLKPPLAPAAAPPRQGVSKDSGLPEPPAVPADTPPRRDISKDTAAPKPPAAPAGARPRQGISKDAAPRDRDRAPNSERRRGSRQ